VFKLLLVIAVSASGLNCFGVPKFLDPEDGSSNATVVVVVVVISSLKIPNNNLNTQHSTTKFCIHIHAHITDIYRLKF